MEWKQIKLGTCLKQLTNLATVCDCGNVKQSCVVIFQNPWHLSEGYSKGGDRNGRRKGIRGMGRGGGGEEEEGTQRKWGKRSGRGE